MVRMPHPLVALALLAGAVAGTAEAQPISGRYQARPGPVEVCDGNYIGACSFFWQLEGSLDFEIFSLPFPGTGWDVGFVDSDLRLRWIHGGLVQPVRPFPAATDLPLSALTLGLGPGHETFVSPAGEPVEVELALFQITDTQFLLRGSYDAGCCGGDRYEILGVLFDWTGPREEEPALTLLDQKFRIAVQWRDGQGGSGIATPIALDDRSGRFWFFRPDNPELLVKVIDACEPFGRWWFFAAGLTDVEVEIRAAGPGILDHKVYTRPAGEPFQPVLDTEGFACQSGVI